MPAAANTSPGSGSSGSVEFSREATQKKVNALHQQLIAAHAAGAKRVYVAPQLGANAGLYARLQTLEARLREKSALLRDNDPSIQALHARSARSPR